MLPPNGTHLKASQVRLKPFCTGPATSFWISDDLVFVPVRNSQNQITHYEAYVNDTKLTTNAPWTKNQTEYLIDPLNNSTEVEFLVLNQRPGGPPVNSKIIIKKENVYKSTSCGNRVTNCFNTDRVTDFTANRYRR